MSFIRSTFLALGALFFAFPLSVRSEPQQAFFCARLLVKVQHALASGWDDYALPLQYLKSHYGAEAYSAKKVSEFEDDVEQIYIALFDSELAGHYNWQKLAKKWKLQDRDVEILKSYYSLHIFEGHPELVGKKDQEVKTLLQILRRDRLKRDSAFRERVKFYEERLGRLSVPEIAREKGATQAQVYREVNDLGLSVVDAFNGNFNGESSEALEFVRHHVGLESRGVSWSRVLSIEGRIGAEVEHLILMKDSGMTHSEIAKALNEAQGEAGGLRTEASVSHKLRELDYSEPNKVGASELRFYPYGLVKSSGKIIPEKAIEYYYDHRNLNLSEIAKKFEVDEKSFKRLLLRHAVLESKTNAKGRESSEGLQSFASLKDEVPHLRDKLKLELWREFEHSVFDFMAEAGEFPALKDEFWKEKSPTNFSRVLGIGNYAPGKDGEVVALSSGRIDALERLELRMEKEKYEKIRSEQQLEKIERALRSAKNLAELALEKTNFEKLSKVEQWRVFEESIFMFMAETGSFPSVKNSFWRERSPVHLGKAFGMQVYAPGEARQAVALSSGRGHAIAKLERRFEKAKQEEVWTERRLMNIANALEAIRKIEKQAVDVAKFEKLPFTEQKRVFGESIFRFIVETGAFPSTTNSFWKEKSPVGYKKAFGIGPYSAGGKYAGTGFSSGRLDAIKNLESRLKKDKQEKKWTDEQLSKIDKVLKQAKKTALE